MEIDERLREILSRVNIACGIKSFEFEISKLKREFKFIIKTTNKFAMNNSRQPDIRLRQKIVLAQDRLLVPLSEKCTSVD